MNIFFDVDYTIVGMDGSLRPGTREVFQRLRERGHHIYIWSGFGVRRDVVRTHGLEPLVSGVFEKPLSDHERRLEELGIPVRPDFAVDDYPEVVSAFGGVWISPYYYRNDDDREMERVYRVVLEYERDGHSTDSRFRPKRTKTLP